MLTPRLLHLTRRVAASFVIVAVTLYLRGGDPAAQTAPQTTWLQDLNAYRASAGLAPVTENPSWSAGAALHARYTVKTDIFSSTENPASPWFSAGGAAAAAASIGVAHSSPAASDRLALDRWIRSPFTALMILSPRLLTVGFGSYREADNGIQMSAWLDMTRGRGEVPATTAFPLKWPVNGAIVPLPLEDCAPGSCADFPSVLESCPGFAYPMGFPLILQLGPAATAPVLSHSSLSRQGAAQPLEHCVISEATFNHSDATQRSIGRSLLALNHAVVIIPKAPLAAGIRYTASLGVNGSTHTWSFDVASQGATPLPGVGDVDLDGLPGGWETTFGLNPFLGAAESGPSGDPDRDGKPNIDEYRENTHPRGFHTRYFAEGATGSFFEMQVALMNPTATPASVLLRFLSSDGTMRSQPLTLPPFARGTVRPRELPGLEKAEFSVVVESDVQVVADRTMTWDASGYGSHAETAIATPAPTWYLAEGATHSGFDLFYLIQNPNNDAVTLRVKYLLPSGPALEKNYLLAPNSRFNIWVNEEARSDPALAALASAEISAVLTATGGPVIVERAMYLSSTGRTFGAGHNSAAVTAPATSWFFAEGATGDYFDTFILLANPQEQDAQVAATYLLRDGTTIERSYLVPANSRRTVWVDSEDARLADAAVSTSIAVTNGVPVIAERAMWWPGPTAATWQEAHNSPGATATGTRWGLAEGEVGGSKRLETYILIANTSAFAASVRVTLLFVDGTTAFRTYSLTPRSRFNVAVAPEFPEASGKQFGAIVESLGSTPAQIVVERAMYSNADGVVWAAGTNALATLLQ